jgi:hypothetical protein
MECRLLLFIHREARSMNNDRREEQAERFDSWAIVELMGHVRMAGRVTEEERFGVKLGRVDVPGIEGAFITVYFSGASLYRLTPTTEEIARHVAKGCQPQPVHRWELPEPEQAREILDGEELEQAVGRDQHGDSVDLEVIEGEPPFQYGGRFA